MEVGSLLGVQLESLGLAASTVTAEPPLKSELYSLLLPKHGGHFLNLPNHAVFFSHFSIKFGETFSVEYRGSELKLLGSEGFPH